MTRASQTMMVIVKESLETDELIGKLVRAP